MGLCGGGFIHTLLGPGQLLARAQAGRHAEGVERESISEPGEELVQGEGAAEFGVARLGLQRGFGQQPVERVDGSASAHCALQEQTEPLHCLQGYLDSHNSTVSLSSSIYICTPFVAIICLLL